MSKEVRGVLYTCDSERDNPFDKHADPKRHAVWHESYLAIRQELNRHQEGRFDVSALKEGPEAVVKQCQFALVWRPYFRPFRLRVHDVIRIDGRLGRVIRVTECAAVVVVNPPARAFKTRFDRQVRFQPSAVTVRISANSEAEILNRKQRKKHNHVQTERRRA